MRGRRPTVANGHARECGRGGPDDLWSRHGNLSMARRFLFRRCWLGGAIRTASEMRLPGLRALTGSFARGFGSELYSSAFAYEPLLPFLHGLVIALYAVRALQTCSLQTRFDCLQAIFVALGIPGLWVLAEHWAAMGDRLSACGRGPL